MTDPTDPIAALEQRAQEDPEFRAALLADPRSAIESTANVSLPADWEIAVHVDANDEVRIGFVDDHIPEEYLSLVSGGSVHGNEIMVSGPSCPKDPLLGKIEGSRRL